MAITKYEDKSGKTYYRVSVSVRSKLIKNKRVQKKCSKLSSYEKAKRVEKSLYQQAFEEVAALDGQGYLWETIIEKWFQYKKVDTFEPIGAHTLQDYYAALHKWTKPILKKAAKNITRADIRNILRTLEENKLSKSFQAKMKGTISRVYTWGIEEGLIIGVSQSPTYGIKVNRKEEKDPLILNKNEINKLLYSARELDSPWYPIWAMALLTGCRNGELFALTWDDVDFSNRILRISKSYNKRLRVTKSTKSGKWRSIPINDDLYNLLLELKNSSNGNHILPRLRDWCHGNQAKELRKFCKGIGITQIKFHTLRACFATQLLQEGVPSITVMKVGGWKELDVMNRYVRLSGIDESGATDCLKFLPEEKAMTKVISLRN